VAVLEAGFCGPAPPAARLPGRRFAKPAPRAEGTVRRVPRTIPISTITPGRSRRAGISLLAILVTPYAVAITALVAIPAFFGRTAVTLDNACKLLVARGGRRGRAAGARKALAGRARRRLHPGLTSSGTVYCQAGTTTSGCVPAISGTGSASAGSGFTI
jgi:hypothetical protein